MNDASHCIIRFKHRALAELRALLLRSERESYAILLAKRHLVGGYEIYTVHDIRYPVQDDYEGRGVAFLRMRKSFIHKVLAETVKRLDVDTLIDVHTHPFAKTGTSFSGVDDRDERGFLHWLTDRFDHLHYGSIVLSQECYQARIWKHQENKVPMSVRASLRTQTATEAIPETGCASAKKRAPDEALLTAVDGVYNRGCLALGLDTMRAIMWNQTIALAGVGGIGSVLAEHLVQMGFQRLILIDPDRLDPSNMNRFVGASLAQAKSNWTKVDAVKEHLVKLNPDVTVTTCAEGVEGEKARELLAISDWIIVSTDSHASRWETQRLALQCFVPLISVGVNITVQNGRIEDMSGEVITVRAGDRWCLNCLGRINLARIASESHPDPNIREQTVQRGYVTGMAVKEPAVKTLNTIIASMAVDRLVDQYLPERPDVPILVYENNRSRAIYEDRESWEKRPRLCGYCGV